MDNYEKFKSEFLPGRGTFVVKDLEDALGISETTARKLVKDGITNGRVKNGAGRGEYDSLVAKVEDIPAGGGEAEDPEDSGEEAPREKRRYNFQPKDDRDQRDEAVLDCIARLGPVSRNEIVGDLQGITKEQAYLSIWRLRRAGTIKRVSIGATYPGWVKA